MLIENHPCLSSADLALQDTGAIAAAEYGRLAVWEHSPLLSRLGAAFVEDGWLSLIHI